jgi:pimeloyl-ACP methyl ester carboxylesterase
MKRLIAIALLAGCASTPPPPKPVPQNPSPTTETTRAHRRLQRDDARQWTTIEGVLPKPVAFSAAGNDLLIHFHGAAWLPMQAAPKDMSVAVVNLGSGSSVYERPLLEPDAFPRLLASLGRKFDRVYVSGFSAGYGAIRAILRTHPDDVDGVLLLDGLHTSYVPDGKPSPLDTTKLEPFVAFARRAVAGEKAFVFTHSEVYPGTYASTTDCADHILGQLGLTRTAVLQWGPGGMQQLSEARSGRFALLGFAGNSAPDHVDHLHAIGEFFSSLVLRR